MFFLLYSVTSNTSTTIVDACRLLLRLCTEGTAAVRCCVAMIVLCIGVELASEPEAVACRR